MLEIKHIYKTYRPKKGQPVTALNDVNLNFIDKGLVFILGKSGSGKSTLLNVIGGLDRADSGEFIIKGKSSEDFSSNDFDAYRNTFIGFIFQEYNILNEFNVGQNIALAMELQGKKATKGALNKILDEVDLSGYATRKPNELSGGQKQRVAIARALIKEPEIIMADEPTGALDSNTGKQVFDTLKKLSKTKLVIVVSHDREFAEYYGDRVIELADGKVISDISKYEKAPDVKSESVSIIDDKIIHVKNGSSLSDKDFEIIRNYLKNNSGDILISSDTRSNESFKQMAMISTDGSKASFKETGDEDTPLKQYSAQDSKFIHSRLPYKNSLKIGASSLKTKPVRLFFTILLCFIAFGLFGVSDTLGSYNKYDSARDSIKRFDVGYATFSVEDRYGEDSYHYYQISAGDDEDLAQVKEATQLDLFPVYSGLQRENYISNVYMPNVGTNYNNSRYYLTNFTGVTELGLESLQQMGASLYAGRMPVKDDEIAITRYQYEMYNDRGYSSSNGLDASIASGEVTCDDNLTTGILNKHVSFSFSSPYSSRDVINDISFTIVGVVDTNISESYNDFKGASLNQSITDYVRYNEFRTLINNGPHHMMFVNKGLISKTINANLSVLKGAPYEGYIKLASSGPYESGIQILYLNKLSLLNENSKICWLQEEKDSLASDEVIADYEIYTRIKNSSFIYPEKYLYDFDYSQRDEFPEIFYNQNAYGAKEIERDSIIRYVIENGVPERFKTKYAELNYIDYEYTDHEWENTYANHLYNFLDYYETSTYENYYDDIVLARMIAVKGTMEFFKNNNMLDYLTGLSYGDFSGANNTDVKLLGFNVALDGDFYMGDATSGGFIVADEVYNSIAVKNRLYTKFIAPMPSDNTSIDRLIRYSYDQDSDSIIRFKLQNEVMTSLDNINDMVETFAKVFLYVGIGLAVFAGLLLSNFISVSIANKKREIGILRAVGAKSADVFTIFFNESIIIALINFVLALIAAIGGCILLNDLLMDQIGITITILSFGIRQIILMLIISVAVAILASFFPVMMIARKQPIDSIQDR